MKSLGIRPMSRVYLEALTAQAVKDAMTAAIPESKRTPPVIPPGMMTRQQVADHLQVSTRKVQRMEASGQIHRCPGFGALVRYATSDVLRLASAPSRKG